MGCDIHMFIEVKKDWGWSHVYRHEAKRAYRQDQFPSPDRDNYFAYDQRNYELFGKLAGVRGSSEPIQPDRGIPEDASNEVKEWLDDSDYHTHSYLTLRELQEADWNHSTEWGWNPFEDFLTVTLERLKTLGHPDAVRILFAFDN